LNINDINDISFFGNALLSSLLFYSVSGNANSMVYRCSVVRYKEIYVLCNQNLKLLHYFKFDGRFGVMVGILAYYARGREFDSRTVQTFVCMNMSVCIGPGRSVRHTYRQRQSVFLLYYVIIIFMNAI
jgi:hypothetical protein